MATTLKSTDLRLPSQRVNLAAPDPDDILMIEDISEGAGSKLKYITKAQVKSDFGIDANTNNHVDHLAAEKPHGVFEGGTKTHTYGLKVADGHLIIDFEEVV